MVQQWRAAGGPGDGVIRLRLPERRPPAAVVERLLDLTQQPEPGAPLRPLPMQLG
jgi:hypothetical protein